jgi:hypothetical protein
MKKPLFLFVLLIICFSSKAQEVMEFNNHCDSINSILSQNQLAYYVGDGKRATNSKMKVISVAYSGTVNVFDSICTIHKHNKCICQKQIPTFNLLDVFNWEIQEGYVFLKDKENQSIGRIYGLKKDDFFRLKTQFDLLRLWSISYIEKEKKIKQDYIKKRNYLPEPKNK